MSLEKAKNFCWDKCFIILFGILILREVLGTTMFDVKIPTILNRLLLLAFIMIALVKIALDIKDNCWKSIIRMGIIGIFGITAIISQYHFLLYIGCAIVAASDVEFEKILKVYIGVSLVVILAAFIASQTGLIENLIYFGGERGDRYSFGSVYPTDFAAHFVYLLTAAFCLDAAQKWKNRIILYILTAGLAVLLYVYCKAYTSVICLVLLCFANGVFRLCSLQRTLEKVVGYLCMIIPTGLAAISIISSVVYEEYIHTLYKWNLLFSERLFYSNLAIKEYPIKLFGQMVTEIGNGRNVEYNMDYFFIDNSYVRIIVEYGIVMFTFVIAMLLWSIVKGVKTKKMAIVIAMIVLCVHSVMEHHIFEMAYNPFIYLMFAELSSSKKKEELEVKHVS